MHVAHDGSFPFGELTCIVAIVIGWPALASLSNATGTRAANQRPPGCMFSVYENPKSGFTKDGSFARTPSATEAIAMTNRHRLQNLIRISSGSDSIHLLVGSNP